MYHNARYYIHIKQGHRATAINLERVFIMANATRAFIIKDDKIIASVTTELKNGAEVYYAYSKIYDNIAHCELLVNARTAKISRAKKWFKIYNNIDVDYASRIDNDAFIPRFLVSSLDES